MHLVLKSTMARGKLSLPHKGRQFWDAIPFTRVIAWGRSLLLAKNYIVQNQMEAARVVLHFPRSKAMPWWLDCPRGAN
jgi:hypothetical protein